MKTTRYFIFTLLILGTLTCVSSSFAQDKYVVRQIYFHPSDRPPPEGIDTMLDTLVSKVQAFYANEMERHGFGRKTFRLETDALGDPVRHYVKGKFTDAHYDLHLSHANVAVATEEIREHFDLSERFVHLLFYEHANLYRDDEDVAHLFTHPQVAGWAWANSNSFGGTAVIHLIDFDLVDFDAKNGALNLRAFTTIAHELGHAFGLPHDFRSDRYIMAYAPDILQDQLSYCAAEWLDAHRYFNTTHNAFDQKPTVRMLEPSFVSPPNTIRLRFEITHSEKLHQARLLTDRSDLDYNVNPISLDCKSLNASNTTIEFVTTELTPANTSVVLRVIDVHGNFAGIRYDGLTRFSIDITSLVPDSESVSIPDTHLASAIREQLELPPESPITKLDMLELRHLRVSNPEKQITDLTGLQHATQLQSLYSTQVADLTPIAKLTNLRTLGIDNIELDDIRPLVALTQLTTLELSSNQIGAISDIRPLAALTQLTTLELDGNQISDIRPLATLTQLTYLNLGRNRISDISPLANLVNLEQLYISSNPIGDIRPLAELTQLWDLSLSQISDISPLANLVNLKNLGILSSQISDISPLAELTKLVNLYLTDNQISDVTPLVNLVNLGTLWLDHNQISDATPLVNLVNLRELRIGYNQISDATPLVNLVNLRELQIYRNPIKNQKPLLDLLRKNPGIKIYLKDGNTPLPVSLSHFRAELTEAGVVLKWTTESELDNAGFYIYRSETKDGEFKVVNPTMVQGAGTTSERNEYTWTDTTAKPNTVYYYQIEDISHAGVRKRLATVRLKGLVSASGKLLTKWADLKGEK